ncbi:MAG: twin-arginine translocase TatA/TatE family subunit [Vulcanimicrobiota bacterium]
MGWIGPGELLLIFIVILIFFGPNKLPELAKTIGNGLRELKKASNLAADELKEELELETEKKKEKEIPSQLTPSPDVIEPGFKEEEYGEEKE